MNFFDSLFTYLLFSVRRMPGAPGALVPVARQPPAPVADGPSGLHQAPGGPQPAVRAAVAQVPCGQSWAGHALDAKHTASSRLQGPLSMTCVLPPPASPWQAATRPRLIEALVARFVRRVQAR